MELTTITAALSGVKHATDIAKIIKNSGASLDTAELKLKFADLIEALADTKIELSNIREILLEKDAQIRGYKEKLEMKDKTIWKDPYYITRNLDGGEDGPYCQKCYDSNIKLIRLQSRSNNGFWQCQECKSNYYDNSYKKAYGTVSTHRSSRMD